MWSIIVILTLVFIGLAFLITERNAKFLLSGYNTMSEENRRQFDLPGYLKRFKKFQLFLGVSFGTIGIPLTFISEEAAIVFLIAYPLLGYLWFTFSTRNLMTGKASTINSIRVIVLIIVGIGVAFLLTSGFREDKLVFTNEGVVIGGMYGETIATNEIASIEIVDELPPIKLRTNGMAMGSVRKGWFETTSGEKVKLIINSDRSPYILISKTSGEKIYYVSKDEDAELIDKAKHFSR